MRKLSLILLGASLSVSLIGIIGIQVYFIRQNARASENRFNLSVTHALCLVGQRLQNREFKAFATAYEKIADKIAHADKKELSLTYEKRDSTGERRSSLSQKYWVDNWQFPRPDAYGDTLRGLYITGRDTEIRSPGGTVEDTALTYLTHSKRAAIEKGAFFIMRMARIDGDRTPISRRIPTDTLQRLIRRELVYNQVNTPFDFAIYDADEITQVKRPAQFQMRTENYKVPLFADEAGNTRYHLVVNFPERSAVILSSVWLPLLLSIVFTLIIVGSYIGALYYIRKQKKVSAIRTDFIDNLTHEFKTPIATISVALSSLRNEEVARNPEKTRYYISMIADENYRMNTQVENMLQLSQLDKGHIKLNKEKVSFNETIREAVSHVKLLVEDRNGTIFVHLLEEDVKVQLDRFHFGNIVVNILENANKYSIEAPEIKVKAFIEKSRVCVSVSDKGIGMSKAEQKQIFFKFYRVPTGDVHDTKGHGLGLAYVRSMAELHGGSVGVQSERGKGTILTVKIPLI